MANIYIHIIIIVNLPSFEVLSALCNNFQLKVVNPTAKE